LALALTAGAGPTAKPAAPGGSDSDKAGDKRLAKKGLKGSARVSIVRARGTIMPEEVVDVGARVSGTIQKFGVDPNDKSRTIDFTTAVKKGTVLAQLDPAPYELELAQAKAKLGRVKASLRRAKAQVALAERELRRTKKRQADKTADSFDVEVAKAKLEVAKHTIPLEEAVVAETEAALRRAQLNLSYTTIRSPIDGIVLDRRCKVGQYVTPNPNSPTLFLLAAEMKRVQIWASIPEADIARVTKGQSAKFTVEPYPKGLFQGRVGLTRLNARLTKGEVTYTVVIEADNPAKKLLPYLTAEVRIEVGGKK
jgi:HlyD family secretion protein